MSMAREAKVVVLRLLLALVTLEDALRLCLAVGRRVGVGDADVEDGCRPLLPESVGGNVTAELWWWFRSGRTRLAHVPTDVD